MIRERSTARTLLYFILISPFLRPALASQAVFPVNKAIKVSVSLGVASRDDNALFVQTVFDKVLEEVSDKVNMTFGYVKDLWPDDEQYGVRCSSDWLDCAGDVQQLCVYKYAPQQNWWSFVMCQNQAGKDEIGCLETAKNCAIKANVPWEIIRDCAGPDANGIDEEGAQLLLQNVKDTIEKGIAVSCTVSINKRVVCVHDNIWKWCKEGYTVPDFVRQIKAAWKKLNNITTPEDPDEWE
ncbi:hypothetical protein BDM02DRAFT_3178974 [Thelephora ganbajun]|uniref:Uncharacterized protein n=1 Tax=Thelephora ganbajun TaxID=370292 RepID=A0ACB6ZP12_THEGA|nr:hypothetical protein BDM02DRAFT_3178974 [Thelephora ganbajun]